MSGRSNVVPVFGSIPFSAELRASAAPAAVLAAAPPADLVAEEEARLVIATADALFQDPSSEPATEPTTPELARLAVEHFAARFAAAPGVFTEALEGARAGAEVLSPDRLQGLAELVQNADDAGATRIRFRLEPDGLLVAHDGRPVNLRDVLALATPWLTTKRDNARVTGRFGIGLMTLQSLSRTLEVYSGPYSIRLGDPSLSWIETPPPTAAECTGETTLLRVPLEPGVLGAEELAEWFSRWDDAALLFCSHVREVQVKEGDRPLCALRLAWTEATAEATSVGGRECTVHRRRARAQDGRCWIVHTTETASPAGVQRMRKARAETMPLGVALPLFHSERGAVYAGLPLAETRLSVRLHGQLDPTSNRQGPAATPWNTALYPLLAVLWEWAVVRLFAETPAAAWPVVPLPAASTGSTQGMVELEQALLDRARSELPGRVAVPAGGQLMPLTALAVEAPRLTGVITEAETAHLAQLPAALPAAARDEEGRWRDVLDDWRAASAQLPAPVGVAVALELLRDPEREPTAVVALVAAAIEAGLDDRLASLPWVVLADGSRTRPPAQTDPWVLVADQGGIGDELGVTRLLHPVHSAVSSPAGVVADWLRRAGALLEARDALAILSRLVQVGEAGRRLPEALSDRQVIALRDAFEALSPEERSRLAAGVGRVIQLRAFRFDRRGRRQETIAAPADAYISQQIEKDQEGFGAAAGRAPDLVWIHGRYAKVLRSSRGRSGLGPARFLRLLGAETVPRLRPHPQLEWRYTSEQNRGLWVYLPNGPGPRREAMEALGATYTLEDKQSPDLGAALYSIAGERRGKKRRARAAAMLGALGRAWDRLVDEAAVPAVLDSYRWQPRGTVRAFWVWQAATIPWLDDAKGMATQPVSLRRRTPGTVAVHGPDAAGYLHKDFHGQRLDVLGAIGVAGDPDTGTLVARLRLLREQPARDDGVAAEAAVLNQTLADRLAGGAHLPGDLSPAKLREVFSQPPGLILTNLGWKRRAEVLSGVPVFGNRRAFVPGARGTKPLWTALGVRSPALDDYVDVLAEMGDSRTPPDADDSAVMLESLRFLRDHLVHVVRGSALDRRLETLPLWTSQGWKTRRPVYVVEDLPLADGLRDRVPVWTPGGEVAQFKSLVDRLRLREVAASSTRVVDAEDAWADEEATETLRSAVGLLKEDLLRNEPGAVGAMGTRWDQLVQLEVRVSPELRVHVAGVGGKEGLVVPVSAKAELSTGVLYLRDSRSLARVDGGGRAIAGLFGTDARRLAQAWLAACEEAQAGREATQLRLAEERAASEQRAIASRLAEFRARTATAHEQRQVGGGRTAAPGTPAPVAAAVTPPSSPAASQRVLIDPSKYRLVDPHGREENTAGPAVSPPTRGSTARPPLPEPRPDPAPIRPGTPPAQYTPAEREKVGLDLLRKVLASDAEEVWDLRAQMGLGADAVDLDGRCFELKVYAGPEPDQVTLEASQIRRALTPTFFLVVVSDVEGDHARPKVRVVVNPLAQLQVAERSSVPFSGVRSAQSLVYEFNRDS